MNFCIKLASLPCWSVCIVIDLPNSAAADVFYNKSDRHKVKLKCKDLIFAKRYQKKRLQDASQIRMYVERFLAVS